VFTESACRSLRLQVQIEGSSTVSFKDGKTFGLEVLIASGKHTLVVTGDLDFRAAPEIEEAIERACAEGAEIVLDLTNIAFMDSAGLKCAVLAHKNCGRGGIGFSVTRGPLVQRLFETSGVAAMFRTPLARAE